MAELTTYDMLIGGDWCAASGGALFNSTDPANGEIWAQIPEASEADVDRAVRAAHAALVGE